MYTCLIIVYFLLLHLPHCCNIFLNIFSPFAHVVSIAGKPTGTITTKGENINICWSPDGQTIAVGNKVGKLAVETFPQ